MNKRIKKIIALIMCLIIGIMWALPIYAHDVTLNVSYDSCYGEYNTDGLNEMWYALSLDGVSYHIGHETTTIKYYISNHVKEDENKTWAKLVQETSSENISSDAAEQIAEEIKLAYVNSMKKWNNVYFYSYDSLGNVVKNKVINIVEVEKGQENLTIFPALNIESTALCDSLDYNEIVDEKMEHNHHFKWEMFVNVDCFFVHDKYVQSGIDIARENVGAHEMGHVLGLRDIDKNNLCGSTNNVESPHHQEIIMGYGKSVSVFKSLDITYKDIAGVAITRGFHTDSDHKWLNAGVQSDGKYKLICSICNGVVFVDSGALSILSYYTYGSCNNNHTLSSGNMMAVASYGNKDYYKCKYCRYVAPFDDIVEQNYSYEVYTSGLHKCTNTVNGLEYTFYEEHNLENYTCTQCNYHSHSYTWNYISYSKLKHWCYCSCGDRILQAHVLSMPNGQVSDFCMLCGELIFGLGTLDSIPSDYPHTENGSYILPNGIIVLVPEDEEAFFNGTLEFRTGEIM